MMREHIAEYLPWLLSALSLCMAWMTGNKWRGAWLFGLMVQALWMLWIWASEKYGFLPLGASLIVIYVRNYRRWKPATGEGGK